MQKNDWILENIRGIMRLKGIKSSILATELGISQGELSKILNGERKNYTEILPLMSQKLGVSFHELVKNDELNQNNYGEIKDNGTGNTKNVYHGISQEVYEAMIKDKNYIIESEREQKDYFKEKYYRLKEKLQKLESNLK